MIYLDHAATSPVRRETLQAMWPYLTAHFGNPSSHHTLGEAAATGLADARRRIATVLGARAGDLVFTAGGTEADNLAIKGISLGDPRGRHLITTPLEHPAVLESVEYLARVHGFEVDYLHPDAQGLVSHSQLAQLLRADTTLVSVHYANNEIGTIQPIRELAAVAHQAGVPFHSDAVQAAGWLPLDVKELGVDALSISGHKFGTPKGIGLLWVRGRIPLEPLLHGGGQERGRRSGTENVAGVVALASAVELAEAERTGLVPRIVQLRDHFIAQVLAKVRGAQLSGHPSLRLPASASFVIEGVSGEGVLLELERRGVICSSGSACAAGSDDPSPVLLTIGIPGPLAQSALRFTLGPTTTLAEIDQAAAAVVESVGVLRQLQPR
ncbi:Cysteine desulfurase [Corynebacterium occultum]|uniref:cysteine desulfurase n=1 Tax=Corynebacterium occultum TaxID=2675219 RepID=A0A6B8W6I9_9CORY|nr:cysteine desulfurase family protein [Corynebacterium occultum]QGU06935.1 Cysteine desulfurase [Corynebacterium occultum]